MSRERRYFLFVRSFELVIYSFYFCFKSFNKLNFELIVVVIIIWTGRMDLKECDSKKLAKGMKRPFGVASIEVTDILSGKMDNDDEKQYFIPFLQSVIIIIIISVIILPCSAPLLEQMWRPWFHGCCHQKVHCSQGHKPQRSRTMGDNEESFGWLDIRKMFW